MSFARLVLKAGVAMQDFRKLHVWHLSHQLVLHLYETTRRFPDAERYGLTAQLRRSAISVPSNLAEGCGRGSNRDFARFIQIAFGSANEQIGRASCREIG